MVRGQGEADGEFAKLGFKSEINIEFFDLLLYKALFLFWLVTVGKRRYGCTPCQFLGFANCENPLLS